VSANSQEEQSAAALRVERAIAELRRGRAIDVLDIAAVTTVAAVERLGADALAETRDAAQGLELVVSAERADALGLPGYPTGTRIRLSADMPADQLLGFVGMAAHNPDGLPVPGDISPGDPRTGAALSLARHARLIPALLVRANGIDAPGLEPLAVSVADIACYPSARGRELQRLSRARVPLAASEDCEFVVYREPFNDAEHVAIVIGRPDPARPVPVRLHSSCLTGDLLASLRCDCGDQLRGAVERIAETDGGVILYLAQEGRGIGLVNKLRAYALQEQGLDTMQADRFLGFRDDERDYTVACAMLKDLGIARVVLLTNNPGKIAALDACDIEVVGRMPLPAAVNAHNARYLRTKRERAGHLPSDCCGEGAEGI
jgi:GTP cyclohydrolase II